MTKTRKVITALLVIAVVTGAFIYWKIREFAASELTIDSETIFTLPAGSGRVVLQAQLESKHIIPTGPWFSILQKLELANLKSGTYRFTPNMTVRKMLQLLSSGKEAQFPLRFVEGTRMQEWLSQLRSASYIKHTLKNNQIATVAAALGLECQQQGVEGWFYPDTYFYTAQTSDVALLKRANARMVKLVDSVWHGKMANLPYRNKNDMLTMASIIEKETSVSSERSRVASVFVNRLQLGMRLQTDPTVIYGMGDNYEGILTLKDLETPTAYNTYTISGLPPGPIAMPGKASLEAAAHPDKTDFLYFVADGKGGHTFTTNLSSHNKAVQIYRLAMQGKNE